MRRVVSLVSLRTTGLKAELAQRLADNDFSPDFCYCRIDGERFISPSLQDYIDNH